MIVPESHQRLTAPRAPLLRYSLDSMLTVTLSERAESIELIRVGQLSPGSGTEIVLNSLEALKKHPKYVLEEHEHSALLAPPNQTSQGAVYQLVVGCDPLTWHRHPSCALRLIQFTTGSGGAIARFSAVTDEELAANTDSLFAHLIEVVLPPDSQIVLRFNGHLYHQFAPLEEAHPAFCGISFHPNETAEIEEAHRDWHQALQLPSPTNEGSIPFLSKFLR